MIIAKITMICLIILICSYLGNIKANSFKERYIELKKFKSGLNIFKSKLEFTYEPIQEIFEDISKLCYDGKDNAFQKYNETLNWNYSVESIKTLEKDDKEALKSLGKMLGKLDKEGQLNEICLAEEFTDKQIEIAFEDMKKNERLYKILGRSAGIAIAIILI